MAQAATFNFDLDAEAFWDANQYEGTFDQVYGDNPDAVAAGTSGGNTVDGITVNASAFVMDGEEEVYADPFMDSRGFKQKVEDYLAGLGVCSSGDTEVVGDAGNISNCSTGYGSATGDDNLLFPEVLELTFSGVGQTYSIDSLFIRDADHLAITAEDAIMINGDMYDALGGYVLGLDSLANSTVFSFTSTSKLPEIYLSALEVSAVPIPAAGFLLLGGLGGLAAMKRRKKAA